MTNYMQGFRSRYPLARSNHSPFTVHGSPFWVRGSGFGAKASAVLMSIGDGSAGAARLSLGRDGLRAVPFFPLTRIEYQSDGTEAVPPIVWPMSLRKI